MSGLCGVGTQMFTKYKIHMATFLECCSRGRPACSYPQEDEAMPVFKNAVVFLKITEIWRDRPGSIFKKTALFIKKLVQKLDSATSDFFYSVKFLNTGLCT
jgi:hypothetical protein